MDIKSLKRALRGEALARRDALDERWRIEASLAMADRAREIEADPGDIVSGFWPMRSEVDVRPLRFALMERGARLCLPAILDKATIVFRELVRGAPLIDMGFGTSGPGPEAAILEPTMMLVPLAALRLMRNGVGSRQDDRRRVGALTAMTIFTVAYLVLWASPSIPSASDAGRLYPSAISWATFCRPASSFSSVMASKMPRTSPSMIPGCSLAKSARANHTSAMSLLAVAVVTSIRFPWTSDRL